jgi:hypothetical protein
MGFSQYLYPKSGISLFGEALVFVRCQWWRLALFIVPLIAVNLAGLFPAFSQVEQAPAARPAALFLPAPSSGVILVEGRRAAARDLGNGWVVLESLPARLRLAVSFIGPDGPVRLEPDTRTRRFLWLDKTVLVDQVPASFPPVTRTVISLPGSALSQLGAFLVNLLLVLLLFSHASVFYFNKPPARLGETLRLAGHSLPRFLAVGLLLGLGNALILLASLLFPILVPPAVWLLLRTVLAPAVVLTEGEGPIAAIGRSFLLTRGQWPRLLLFLIVAALALVVLFALAILLTGLFLGADPVAVSGALGRFAEGSGADWPLALALVYGIFITGCTLALPPVLYLVFALYMDLRIRAEDREGTDKAEIFKSG